MITIYKKSILTGIGPSSIDNLNPDTKKELEDIIYDVQSFFNFQDYTNIYFDDRTISIQWKSKYDTESITDLEKNLKNKIDSFIKKIYSL